MKRWMMILLAAMVCLTAAGCQKQPAEPPSGGISAHGWLSVDGVELRDESGKTAVLRGMSSHGISWYPRYLNGGAMQTLREYGANLFRVAVYTEPEGAYLDDPARSLDYLYMGIESALAADMYVIVDWHILKDGDPNAYADEAEDFWREISARYADEPGVIYEICNEPNGDTGWDDVKAYAQRVIPVIRSNSPKSLILVGTPGYCTDFTGPLKDPLAFDNIMYAMHRYVDISADEPCGPSQLTGLLAAGLPVFVTEWGVSADDIPYASGDVGSIEGVLFPESAQPFIDEMADYQISWAGWSLSNKAEWHSALLPGCEKLSGWTKEDLTVSGRLMFENFAPQG